MDSHQAPDGLVPLIEGSLEHRVSYQRALRLVVLGRVRGERIEGKWWIDPVDLGRWARENREPVEA